MSYIVSYVSFFLPFLTRLIDRIKLIMVIIIKIMYIKKSPLAGAVAVTNKTLLARGVGPYSQPTKARPFPGYS